MTCHELDERLDDWLDGALAAPHAQELEAHLASCEACRERVRQMRQLLAHAAALPRSLQPDRDLWPGVRDQVERRSAWVGFWTSWQPVALAAAATLALAAGVYLWQGPAPSPVRTVAMPSPSAAPLLQPVAGASGFDPVLAEAARNYERAAGELLEALQQRRTALQPEDLARVEANLEVIDRALAEVREALVRDPGSPELNRMLVATHKKKVDVLRRVVRLSTVL
jgi:anti-sigma factor RsiW